MGYFGLEFSGVLLLGCLLGVGGLYGKLFVFGRLVVLVVLVVLLGLLIGGEIVEIVEIDKFCFLGVLLLVERYWDYVFLNWVCEYFL